MRKRLAHIAIFLLVAFTYGFGLLDFLELKLLDTRFRFLDRPATGSLVLIEIGARDLKEIGVWPWPRMFHARLVERLLAAGASRIAFDIDFSSRSSLEADQAFERALVAAEGRVILPVFRQFSRTEDGTDEIVSTGPIPEFARHVAVASINVRPDADGLIRRSALIEQFAEAPVPSLPSLLAEARGTANESFYIDYGIDAGSVARLSYTDVLSGRFDPAAVAGKIALIGSTAIELGDQHTVPRYRTLPGPLVQVLAYESLLQGRGLQRFAPEPILFATLLITLILGPLLVRWSWREGLLVLCSFCGVVTLLAVFMQAFLPLTLDTVPWLLAVFLSYAFALVRRLRQQDLRLFAIGLMVRRKNAFMRGISRNSFDGIVTIDESEIVRSFNQAAERMFGHEAKDVVGNSARMLESQERLEGTKHGIADALRIGGGPYEVSGKRSCGEVFPLEVSVTDMVVNDQRMCIALMRDISAQRRAEARAEEARARLGNAIECISEGFVLYDAEDRLVLCNSKFRAMMSIASDLLVPGWRYEDVMRGLAEMGWFPAAEDRIEEWLRERAKGHRNPSRSYEELLGDGRYVRVSERRTNDGGVVGVYTDITEMKEREESLHEARIEAETASRIKTEFLHNMSHELRTPLNAIIGFSEIMKGELFGQLGNAQYKGYTNDIFNSGTHLLGIINDVLDVSKIEAGKYELNEQSVEVGQTIDACLRLIDERIRSADQTLSVDVPDTLPALFADERAVRQVLLNLLSNAVKFTPQGGTISVRAAIAQGGGMTISVADTGIGIAAENIPKALTAFHQVDSKVARKYEGTGLGLPLTKSLVEMHGGTMRLDSEVDVGTTVTVEFPADRLLPTGGKGHETASRSDPKRPEVPTNDPRSCAA